MLKAGEKGFTLVEVLVALAIAGAVISVTSAAVITVIRTTGLNDEWNTNLRQVQNAGNWITKDVLMAQSVSDNTDGVFLDISWSDWDNNNNNVQYIINGDNTLTRSFNGGPAILISQYIVTDNTTCDWNADEQKLTVNIKASLHGQSPRAVQETYEISPRPMNRGG